MFNTYRVFKIVLITSLAAYLCIHMIIGGIAHYQKQNLIRKIMDGEVRGNKSSLIYHLAPCPNYNSISPENLKVFKSTEEAEEAEYLFTKNCDDKILQIRKINEDYPDGNPYE